MADGSRKPIKDVKLSDKVLATDPTTGRTEAREITDVRSQATSRTLVEVTVDGNTGTDRGTVVTTDEHPFWVASENRWSNAIDLKPGHKITTADNRDATVTGTRSWSEVRRVYNLTVDTTHTYYVFAGTSALLTHNDPGCKQDPTWGGAVKWTTDGSGRPTTMSATLTKQMIGEGTSADSDIRPPGFAGGRPIGDHARGHLLGKQLGGSGDIAENLVTLFQNPLIRLS
ncbi:polymorphic toxin-type HINT domain-containing protein [Kibdelosporangium philippinense]|uniref:polymorphic toxin-type HINT domain-containing protein n=1 Tax=Kibdelosporangium philippinense TaxID=211113 RepID=UPI00361669B8